MITDQGKADAGKLPRRWHQDGLMMSLVMRGFLLCFKRKWPSTHFIFSYLKNEIKNIYFNIYFVFNYLNKIK